MENIDSKFVKRGRLWQQASLISAPVLIGLAIAILNFHHLGALSIAIGSGAVGLPLIGLIRGVYLRNIEQLRQQMKIRTAARYSQYKCI